MGCDAVPADPARRCPRLARRCSPGCSPRATSPTRADHPRPAHHRVERAGALGASPDPALDAQRRRQHAPRSTASTAKGRTVARITLARHRPLRPRGALPRQRRPAAGRRCSSATSATTRRGARTCRSSGSPSRSRSGGRRIKPTWYRFKYPDGPHDAEALLVDPRDGRIWIATKSLGTGGLYVRSAQAGHRVARHQQAAPRGRRASADHRRRVPAQREVRAAHLHVWLPLRRAGQARASSSAADPAAGRVDRRRRQAGCCSAARDRDSKVLAVPLPAGAIGKSTPTPTPSATHRRRDPFSLVAATASAWRRSSGRWSRWSPRPLLVFIVARLRRDR